MKGKTLKGENAKYMVLSFVKDSTGLNFLFRGVKNGNPATMWHARGTLRIMNKESPLEVISACRRLMAYKREVGYIVKSDNSNNSSKEDHLYDQTLTREMLLL